MLLNFLNQFVHWIVRSIIHTHNKQNLFNSLDSIIYDVQPLSTIFHHKKKKLMPLDWK